MKIKLIALDLDGTLLTSEKKITEHSFAVLSQCMERGIYIVPATGRTASGIPKELMENLGIQYAITINGAVIADIKENVVIAEHKLNWNTAGDILRMMQGHPVLYDAYIDGRGKAEERFLSCLEEYGISSHIQALIRSTRECVPDIMEYIERNRKSPDKINLFFKDRETKAWARAVLKEVPELLVSSSLINNLELNGPGASKGQALTCLADYLGISMEETMAFGDGENDLSMLTMAGLGVAMGNGEEAAKKAARYVTDSNDHDGIAKAIEKFVLNEKEIEMR